jgi:hypothetical protein
MIHLRCQNTDKRSSLFVSVTAFHTVPNNIAKDKPPTTASVPSAKMKRKVGKDE